jgi:ribosomal protein L7Ae-like RNA K-turn-binding protein
MREKIHSYLGFSKRSRSLISGYNSCIYGLERRKIRLLILTEDLAENTLDKFKRLAIAQGIPLRIYGTKDTISDMTGEDDRGIFGITDKNLARVILEEIDRDEQNDKKE